MRPKTSNGFLTLILSALFMLLAHAGKAQQYIYPITTSVGNSIPLGGTTNIRQNLYFPSNFPTAPAGMITKIYFQPSATGTFGYTTLVIKMGYTSLSAFSAGPFISGLTTVYSGSPTLTTITGPWVEIPLQTPFFYDGVQNFIVEASQQGYTSSMSAICDNSTAATNRSLYGTTSTGTGTLQARVMRLAFDLTPGSLCTSVSGLAASSVTNISATLSWGAVTNSQGYEYVLNNTATAPTGSGTLIPGTSYPAVGLTPNTTYYMHVRNKCSSTSFSGWTTISFTTQNFVSCYPPVAASVTNLTMSTGTLSWSPVASSQGYEYVVNQAPGNPTGNGTFTATTSAPLTGLTGNTTYYAHVRNICQANDKSAWLHQQFTTASCNTPVNVIISNITDSTAHVLWSQMPNAGSYEYAIDFSNQDPVTGIMQTPNIAVGLSDLVPNSKYYFHLRSKCFSIDTSGWRLDSFVTKLACYPPIVQVNHLGTNNPYAFWDPVPTAIAYEYALTNTLHMPAFGTTIYTPYITLALEPDGKDYYLHVRSKCNSMFTFSQWSTVPLRTGSTGIGTHTTGRELTVQPNPVNDFLQLRGGVKGEISVTDVTGRVVLLQRATGAQTETVNTTALPAGVYLLSLTAEGQQQQVKFVKQ